MHAAEMLEKIVPDAIRPGYSCACATIIKSSAFTTRGLYALAQHHHIDATAPNNPKIRNWCRRFAVSETLENDTKTNQTTTNIQNTINTFTAFHTHLGVSGRCCQFSSHGNTGTALLRLKTASSACGVYVEVQLMCVLNYQAHTI